MFLNVICKFLVIYFKVCMCKISDKSDKFLLKYSNLFCSGVHFFTVTVYYILFLCLNSSIVGRWL